MSDNFPPPSEPLPEPRPDPYAPPAYAANPYAQPARVERPGRVIGIVGFILSFFGFIDIVGLVLSIVGLVQSKRAGNGNGFAVAGIIISAVGIAVTALILALVIPQFVHLGEECARLGTGTHQVGNLTYVCTPTSANVYTN